MYANCDSANISHPTNPAALGGVFMFIFINAFLIIELREALVKLARQKPRYGYRRPHILLHAEVMRST